MFKTGIFKGARVRRTVKTVTHRWSPEAHARSSPSAVRAGCREGCLPRGPVRSSELLCGMQGCPGGIPASLLTPRFSALSGYFASQEPRSRETTGPVKRVFGEDKTPHLTTF